MAPAERIVDTHLKMTLGRNIENVDVEEKLGNGSADVDIGNMFKFTIKLPKFVDKILIIYFLNTTGLLWLDQFILH